VTPSYGRSPNIPPRRAGDGSAGLHEPSRSAYPRRSEHSTPLGSTRCGERVWAHNPEVTGSNPCPRDEVDQLPATKGAHVRRGLGNRGSSFVPGRADRVQASRPVRGGLSSLGEVKGSVDRTASAMPVSCASLIRVGTTRGEDVRDDKRSISPRTPWSRGCGADRVRRIENGASAASYRGRAASDGVARVPRSM